MMSEELDRDTLQRLSQRSDAHGLRQLVLHMALLGATASLVFASRGRLWLLPAMLIHGIALDFLFCALHESVHRTAFASRALNDAVAWVAGALLLLPPQFFRAFHFAHHRFTQDPARDPELGRPPPATLTSYLWHLSGMPNWARRITVTVRHAWTGRVREPFVADGKQGAIIREARILWAVYAAVIAVSLVFRSDAALLYWIIPAILGQPFLRAYLLAEHTGCALGDDTYANTRTTYTNAAVRALTWQMPYHVEHHAFPAVPFYALRRLNQLLRPRIQVSAPGYLAVQAGLIRRMRRPRAAGRSEAL
ncbi:MAG TPA: fatty acid desaturase [Steroidobacteraceae bacterium]|nr:fatty acid desaturase [Steroidobacteraceae bacterium]